MGFLSAFDDLRATTLKAIPGLLGRIEYVSSLKEGGRYAHWGLTRVHGNRAAERALSDAHKLLVAEVLQTPLRLLVADNEASCASEGRETHSYLEGLSSRQSALLPPEDAGQPSELHFSSVLCALSALARALPRATLPNA
jgi:hypothetical protein